MYRNNIILQLSCNDSDLVHMLHDLQSIYFIEQCYMSLPVIQYDIRQPYVNRWHINSLHPTIVSWWPCQLVVIPLLKNIKCYNTDTCEIKVASATQLQLKQVMSLSCLKFVMTMFVMKML